MIYFPLAYAAAVPEHDIIAKPPSPDRVPLVSRPVERSLERTSSMSTTSSLGQRRSEARHPDAAHKAPIDVLQAPACRIQIPKLSALYAGATAAASRSPSLHQTEDPFTLSRVGTGEVLGALQGPEAGRAACWWLYETETMAYTPDIAKTGLSATDLARFKDAIGDLREVARHQQRARVAHETSLRSRICDRAFLPKVAGLRRRKSDIEQRAFVAVLADHCAALNEDLKARGKRAAYDVDYVERIGIRFEIHHTGVPTSTAGAGLRG